MGMIASADASSRVDGNSTVRIWLSAMDKAAMIGTDEKYLNNIDCSLEVRTNFNVSRNMLKVSPSFTTLTSRGRSDENSGPVGVNAIDSTTRGGGIGGRSLACSCERSLIMPPILLKDTKCTTEILKLCGLNEYGKSMVAWYDICLFPGSQSLLPVLQVP